LLAFTTSPAQLSPVPLLATPFNEAQGRISPDGRWLAYACDETGRYEIYLRSLDGNQVNVAVSRQGGVQPRRRLDGKELFFLSRTEIYW
jgi:eukaryotic-like serine/threonine-protein kinase